MRLERNIGKRYFTGKPCKYGHIAERLISNKNCIECLREKKLTWASNNSKKLNDRKRAFRLDNIEKLRKYEKSRYQNDPRQKMLSAAKQRAKFKNLNFDIALEDITIPEVCPLLGIELIVSEGTMADNSPSLDRINNNFGYIKGNIIIISQLANRCKSNLNSDQMLMLAKNLKDIEWLAKEKGFI